MPKKPAQKIPNTLKHRAGISTSQAASLLRVSCSTIRKLESDGKIKSNRGINGYRSFPLADVVALKSVLEQDRIEINNNRHKAVKSSTNVEHSSAKPVTAIPTRADVFQNYVLNQHPALNTKNGIKHPSPLLKTAFIVIGLFLLSNAMLYKGDITPSVLGLIKRMGIENKNQGQNGQGTGSSTSIASAILGLRDREASWKLTISTPTTMKETLTVEKDLNVAGIATLPTLNGVKAIDALTTTTFENALAIAGDVTGVNMLTTIVTGINGVPLGVTTATTGNVLMGQGNKWESLPQTAITSLGTITAGVWQGTLVATTFGGTGLASYVTGDMLYASGSNVLAALPIGVGGFFLSSTGTAPIWTDMNSIAWLRAGNTGTSSIVDFIGTTDIQDLAFRTNNIERLRVTSDGKVGIGTTSPASMLSVGASSQFQVNSTGNIVMLNNVITSFPSSQGVLGSLLTNDGSGTITWGPPSGSGALGYWQRNGTSVAPSNIGDSLGVGTTGPRYTLDVNGTGRFVNGLTLDNTLAVTGTSTLTGTLDSNGDVSIADTNIAFDGASTTFTTTGAFTLTPGGATTLGDGVDTMYVNSSDWDISTTGDLTGIGGISADGSYTQTGVSANTFTGTSTFSNATYSAFFTGGNVGVGTTAPSQLLEVNGASKLNGVYIGAANSTTISSGSSGGSVTLEGGATSHGGQIDVIGGNGAVTNSGTILFYSGIGASPAWGEHMRLDASGNVGIGTTGPISMLSVGASSQFQVNSTGNIVMLNNVVTSFPSSQGVLGSLLTNNGSGTLTWGSPSGTGALGYWQRNGTSVAPSNIGDYVGVGTTAPGALLEVNGTSWLRGGTAPTSGLFVNASGNVGIGTTAPGTKLHLYGATPTLRIEATTGTNSALQLQQADTENWQIYVPSSGQGLSFRDTTDSADRMVIGNTGNIGIGTTAPGMILDIQSAAPVVRIKSTTGTNANYLNFSNTGGNSYVGTENSAGNGLIGSGGLPYAVALGHSAAYPVQLFTNNIARVTVDATNGNVGIGTTGPISMLSVGASSQFQVNSTGNIVMLNNVITSFPSSQGVLGSLLTNNGSGTLTWGSPSGTGALGYWQRNGTSVAPSNIGDFVGIGTTGPVSKLTLAGGNFITPSADSTSAIGFASYASPTTPILNVDTTNGRIGIGTTAPKEPLEVAAANNHGIRISGIGTETSPVLGLYANSANANNRNWAISTYQSTYGDFQIRSSNTNGGNPMTAGTAMLEILSNGNVGIGTTAPTSMLSVGASSQFQVNSTGNIVMLNNVTTSFPSAQGVSGSLLTNNGSGTLTWGSPAGTGTLGYWQRNGTSLAPSNIGDFVGIGTTSPSKTLSVLGDIFASDNLYLGTTTESINNVGFALDGNDLFVEGMGGFGGNVYTNGSFVAGASTTYGNGSISQSSGETLSIGTTSANLTLQTTTSGNIILSPAGNVGIGTTAPLALLDVSGTAWLRGNTSPYSGLFVNALGNVGIGTTSPLSPLDVAGTTGIDAITLSGTGTKKMAFNWNGTTGINMDIFSADTTNKLLNNGFESDLTSWANNTNYTLNDEFTTAAPTTLVSGVSGLTNGGVITPSLGSELVVNGGMEGIYVAGVAPSWSKTANISGTYSESTLDVHGGTSAQQVIVTGASQGLYQVFTSSTGSWYLASSYNHSGGTQNISTFLRSGDSDGNGTIFAPDVQTNSVPYTLASTTGRAISTASHIAIRSSNNGTNTLLFDDVSVKPLTLSSLFSTVTESTANKIISAGVTLTAGTQAGIVINADATFANFIIAYHDGTKIYFEKNVGGTYSSIFTAVTATYVADAKLKVIKLGNVYQVVYNNVLIGSGTVSDAGIVAGTYQGLFSTLSTNSFTNFLITTNLDGTQAEPTGGTRTVTDTNGKLSITGGQLSFTSNVAYGNPGIWYPSIQRVAGKILIGEISASSANLTSQFGFDTNTSADLGGSVIHLGNNGNLLEYGNGTIGAELGSRPTSGTYKLAVILRSTGAYYFIVGGSYTNWTFLWKSDLNSTSPLYPAVNNLNATFTADNIRIPTNLWLPTPLAYDTFAATYPTQTEPSGPDTQVTPQLTWTGGTKAAGVMSITPTVATTGGPLNDGNVVTNGTFDADANWLKEGGWSIPGGAGVARATNANNSNMYQDALTNGNWYKATYDISNFSAGIFQLMFSNIGARHAANGSYFDTARATSARFYIHAPAVSSTYDVDNVSVKPLTLSTLFSTVPTSTSNVIADVTISAYTLGTQAGLVVGLDSATSPANFLIAYLTVDSNNSVTARVDQNLNGTYTNIIAGVVVNWNTAYVLRVVKDGTAVRLYYNNVLIGTGTCDASITGTNHGTFSTYSGNTFDNFTLWPRGTGNEYAALPSETLTATQVASPTYGGTAGSVQLVAPTASDGYYLQSVNVGDTSTYTLTAYAYTTGAAVTASDLNLFYGSTALATSYTAVGSGWYKLSGTLTGIASPQNFGIQVKAGKTVYIDRTSLQSDSGNRTLNIANSSSTGLAQMNVESTTTLNSGDASLQGLIVKGFAGQTNNLQEWQNSSGTVLGSINSSGNLTLSGLTASSGVYTDSNKMLVSTPPTSGTLGFWQRNGTSLAPSNIGDFVGIGTTSPTNILSLGGDTARTFWMERGTVSNTAGFGLTVQAGGATSGATDKNGGALALKSGLSTGTGTGQIQFWTSPAGTTGGISTINATPTAGGTLYTAGDTLTVTTGGTSGTVTVATVDGGGVILTLNTAPAAAGTGYTTGTGKVTSGGTGSGATVNITAITNTTDNALAQRMTIDGAGNVGIGTTSPAYMLDVAGDIRSTGTLRAGGTDKYGAFLSVSGTTNVDGIYAENLATGGTNQIGGYFANYPSNPAATLFTGVFSYTVPTTAPAGSAIYGFFGSARNRYGDATSYAVGGYFSSEYSPNSPYSSATLNLTKSVGLISDVISGPSGVPDIFEGKNNHVTNFVITGGGSVGIGTTGPQALLEVNGTSWLRGGTAPTMGLYVNNLGNVGIGTTAPGQLLAISGNTNSTIAGQITNSSNGTAAVSMLQVLNDNNAQFSLAILGTGYTTSGMAIANYGRIRASSAVDGMAILTAGATAPILFGTANTERMRITSDGNVGIGTTGPGAPLQIGASNGSNILFNQDTNGLTDFRWTSDSRIRFTSNAQVTFGSNYTDSNNGAGIRLGISPNYSYIVGGTNLLLNPVAGNVGIGTTAPTSMLSVGPSSQFQVNSTGNILKINNVVTSFPASQGAANSFLRNDGSGNLTWADPSGTGVAGYWQRVGTSVAPTNIGDKVGIGTTAPSSLLQILGTTEQLRLSYDAANYSSFTIDSAGNLSFGSNGTNVATFGAAQASFDVPTTFNAAGDVSMANDLLFTNATSSNIKSLSPLTIVAGEIFNSSNLTLKTYNSGNIVFDSPGGIALTQAQAWDLANSSTTALNIEGGLMNFDTTNSRVGIGTTAPGALLEVNGTSWLRGGTAPTMGLYVNNLGNVGIGTTSPGSKLVVAGDIEGQRFIDSQDGNYFMDPNSTFTSLNVAGLIKSNGSGNNYLLGNVGIGTTGPGRLLDVNVGSSTNAGIRVSTSGTTVATLGSSGGGAGIGALELMSGGSSKVYIPASGDSYFNSGGNVGIGVAAPLTRLHVQGSDGAPSLSTVSGISTIKGMNSQLALEIGTIATAPNPIWIQTKSEDSNGTGDGIAYPLALNPLGGNVGIGTTNPVNNLQLNGTAGNPTVTQNTNNGMFTMRSTSVDLETGIMSSSPYAPWIQARWNDESNPLPLLLNPVGGNVGIGTTGPSELLHVYKNQDATTTLMLENPNTGVNASTNLQFVAADGKPNYITFGDASDVNIGLIRYDHSNDSMAFRTNNTYQMTINSSGNVGIGTTSPGSLLDVYYSTSVTTNEQDTLRLHAQSTGNMADGFGTRILAYIGDNTAVSDYIGQIGWVRDGADNSGKIIFGTRNAGTWDGSRVVIDKSGNVGIGTTGPTQKFEVGGAGASASPYGLINGLRLSGGDTTNSIYNGSRNLGISVEHGSLIQLGDTSGTNGLTVLSTSGNVGIGTTGPAYKLDVVGDVNITGAYKINGVATSATLWGATGTNISNTNAGNVGIGTTAPGALLEVNGTSWLRGGTAPTSGLYVNSSGKVGIGTTSPAARLDVIGNIYSSGGIGFSTTSSLPNFAGIYAPSSDAGALGLVYFNGSAGVEGMRITTTGNVGIGTTGPQSELDVRGAYAAFDGGLTAPNLNILTTDAAAVDKGGSLQFGGITNGINYGFAALRGAPSSVTGGNYSGYLAFYTTLAASGMAEGMRINALGNVGIGTTGPVSKLAVGGVGNSGVTAEIYGVGKTSGTYGLIVLDSDGANNNLNIRDDGYGWLRAASWAYGSDRRLKENITSIRGSGLDTILQLNPVKFDYINGQKGQLGFIAQEVQPVIPEAVEVADGKTGMLGLKTDFIIPYLVKGMQEQQLQIGSLSSKLNNTLTLDESGNVVTTGDLTVKPTDITGLTAAQLTTQEQLNAISNVLGLTDTAESSPAGSLLSRVNDLEGSANTTADELSAIRNQVNLLKELLGINNSGTTESTETTQSSSTGTISTPSQFLAEMTKTFTEFKDFITALGISGTIDSGLLVSSDLNVLGGTTLANLTVTGDITAGSLMINTLESSINFNGSSCYNDITGVEHSDICSAQTIYLQKNLAGNIDIFNGKIVLEPNGTLLVKGTISADKVVSDEFSVRGTSKIVGSAVLKANEKEVIVETDGIKANSKVFVTATSSTGGQALMVTEKLDGVSFKVTIDAATPNDTTFDWWVLNVE